MAEVLTIRRIRNADAKILLDHVAEKEGPSFVDGRVEHLSKAVGSSSKAILAGLLVCGAAQLRLFRDITRLRRDLSISDLLEHNPTNSSQLPSSELFRFAGERPGASEEVVREIESFSPAMRQSLNLLRLQYHHLDR